MSNKQDVQVLLAGRTGAYRIFQDIFGNEPDEAIFKNLANQVTQEVLDLFVSDNNTNYAEALRVLFDFLEIALAEEGQAELRAKDGFTRLFVGPGKVETEPWESIYTMNDQVLFQPSTLEVRKAYVAQGFIPQSYPHVADDHIALELDFMAELSARATKAFDKDDVATAQEYLAASEEFLTKHLLGFVPKFNAALAKAKHNYFYKEAGALLNEFLKVDIGALEEIKSYLES
jgi:TorA maturation chaperone TorD